MKIVQIDKDSGDLESTIVKSTTEYCDELEKKHPGFPTDLSIFLSVLKDPDIPVDVLRHLILMSEPNIAKITACYEHPNCDDITKHQIENYVKNEFVWFLENRISKMDLDKFTLTQLNFVATHFPKVFQDKEAFGLFKQYLYKWYKADGIPNNRQNVMSVLNKLNNYPWIRNDFFISVLRRKVEKL